ncbi:hypothetical protein MIZ03_3020 [Rhodoferax lithotrophicus]|uniref:Uncharacterized protein n=1 Tax=Rhodoferax lithotrophicus TaxID=2798804 RepID=A0ABN6D914_9BURK|nr:hypothetical protein MIZ03_3020 [Rhodoferax sp. MIZ03]
MLDLAAFLARACGYECPGGDREVLDYGEIWGRSSGVDVECLLRGGTCPSYPSDMTPLNANSQ